MFRSHFLKTLTFALAATATVLAAPAHGDGHADDRPTWQKVLDNDYYKIHLNVRLRNEFADFDTLDSSRAHTLRTRLGIGTKPFFGFSVFAEGENIIAFDDGAYFDIVGSPNGHSPIADPEETEVNRLFVQYENKELADVKLKVGRQRIIYDDARFVGNVGWRQNEQTFDAARLDSSFGVEGLKFSYAWLEDIHRIFGGDNGSDFDSNSHIANMSYTFAPELKATVFAYLLEFDNSPINSSDSYGFRLTGKRKLDDQWWLGYVASYAYQEDAENNPVNYDAHYGNGEVTVGFGPLGSIGIGYEHLGSDDGRAVFVTPLATAHKFNGFADVFLNNGGPNGLRDAYLTISPKLPFGLKGKIIYHKFWADENTGELGDEIDFVVTKKLAKGLVLLSKGGWWESEVRAFQDRWRYWLELNYSF